MTQINCCHYHHHHLVQPNLHALPIAVNKMFTDLIKLIILAYCVTICHDMLQCIKNCEKVLNISQCVTTYQNMPAALVKVFLPNISCLVCAQQSCIFNTTVYCHSDIVLHLNHSYHSFHRNRVNKTTKVS